MAQRFANLENGSTKDITYKDVHCILCQRRGRKAKGHYYCQDCHIGLCTDCARQHTGTVRMNRHSVSVISDKFQVSPNQGPFPELTEIGTIKFDVPLCIKGSAFLPKGELVVTDHNNSKVLVFGSDYMKKQISKLLVPKQNKWDSERPKPLDVTGCGDNQLVFTASNGCVYFVKIGTTMIMNVERVIPVICFESDYGECLGIAFNSGNRQIYVGCTSDRGGASVRVYDLDGNLRHVAREMIMDAPDYLTFGIDRNKLYAANTDEVKALKVDDFTTVEEYNELQAQTKGIIVDKWGYLYTLALERRTFKHPGSIYRLDPKTGVTKVTSVNDRPASMCYCALTDDIAVTFVDSRYIYLYKLKLRSFQKQFGNELKPY